MSNVLNKIDAKLNNMSKGERLCVDVSLWGISFLVGYFVGLCIVSLFSRYTQ